MFIQVIFLNMITYLDRTFKKEQNEIQFECITKLWFHLKILTSCNFDSKSSTTARTLCACE